MLEQGNLTWFTSPFHAICRTILPRAVEPRVLEPCVVESSRTEARKSGTRERTMLIFPAAISEMDARAGGSDRQAKS